MKKSIFMLSAALVGSAVLTGCGSTSANTGVKEEKLVQQDAGEQSQNQQDTEQQESSASIKADMKTVKDTKNRYSFSADGLMWGSKKEENSDKDVCYQWKGDTYQPCDSKEFNHRVSIKGKKYSVAFRYAVVDSQLYIADTDGSKKEGIGIYVYPWGNRTDKVWLEVYEGRELLDCCSLDLPTCKTESLLPEELKASEILLFEISGDEKYALATTEENQIFFIDLESKVCEDFSKKVQEKASGAYFTNEHDVRYVVHNEDSKVTGQTYRVWNLESDTSKTAVENVDESTVKTVTKDCLVYRKNDSQIEVVSFDFDGFHKVSVPLKKEKEEFIRLSTNKNGTKAVLFSVDYADNEEDEYPKKAYIVDFEKLTAEEITNIDTTRPYLSEGWTGEDTFTFATEAGLTSYSFGQ